jgi:hypothetical protein
MSIVSSLRDYVEFLNNFSASVGSDNLSKIITESCFYFLKTLQYSVYYIFSFQWLRDFTLLPIIIPQNSQAIFKETFFTETPGKVFFEFLEIPSLDQNTFLLGFFNSFFLTLPITVTHFITVRRLIIQGIPAAFFSFLGYILGQTLFILCVTFGIRSILIPWLSLEPFNYILGLVLIFQIIYSMVGENLTPLKWNVESNKILFRKFFFVNLLLSWCEQSCLFQYFSNLTITGHSSILEGFSTETTLTSFFSHTNYIIGIFLGSLLFSIIWVFFILQLKNLLVSLTGISLSRFVQTINQGTFVIVLTFSLSSIPFYGLDYLVTGPLGFVSQDSLFENTMFDQYQIKNPLYRGTASELPEEKYLNFEVSSFDRGRYLIFPELDEVPKYTFEDLNYRGEMDWTTRNKKVSKYRDPETKLFSFEKFFKKQKEQSSIKKDIKSPELTIYQQYNFGEQKDNYQDSNLSQDNSQDRKLSQDYFRFQDWYKFESSFSREDDLTDKQFKDNFQNFSLNSFSSEFIEKPITPEDSIEKKIKQKYYSNPIYKNLLALDIDQFLNRQPSSSFLGQNHEFDLHEKRLALTSYYDSLRFYAKLPDYETFENFFDGTKSYTNKIYNQQFKGTLHVLGRWFYLNQNNSDSLFEETKNSVSILKYDQPLYDYNLYKYSPYHEEISEIETQYQNQKGFTFDFSKSENSSVNTDRIANPFLTEFISKPLYSGWDEKNRKFVITNKILPRSLTGFEINLPQDFRSKFITDKNGKTNLLKSQKIKFTLWPKSLDFEQTEKPFYTLYTKNIEEYLTSKDYLDLIEDKSYNSLPSNLQIIQAFSEKKTETQKGIKGLLEDAPFNNLRPKRGGFIWPGSSGFDFEKFKNIFVQK